MSIGESQRTTQPLPSLNLGSTQAQLERHGHQNSQDDPDRIRESNRANLELLLLFGDLWVRRI